MKILFLDMDGVVNSEAGHSTGLFKSRFPVDPYMAFLVGKIHLDTDCIVVLSSTWRSDPESVEYINKMVIIPSRHVYHQENSDPVFRPAMQ